ncbi:rRNA maturation RNase YbeY [bacterium]|nr:rRNA maturation RNase YbeY [bacterium]
MMLIEVTAQTKADVSLRWIREVGERILQDEGCQHGNPVSIILVDDAFITQLNRVYFKKNTSTDVISFLLDNDKFPAEKETAWGEVYVSLERAKQQALKYQVTYKEEVARLVIHGILHLLGFDDQTDQDRALMNEKENTYLSQIDLNG